MAQKLDLQPQELDLQPLDLQPVPAPKPKKQDEGFISKAWKTISEAPEFIMDPARKAGMAMTEHTEGESMLGSQLRGFGAGALEAIASMINPLNIATMGKGKYLTPIANMAGGLQAAHGAYDVSQGNILPGIADLGFGMLGMRGAKIPKIGREAIKPEFTSSLPQTGGKTLGEIKAEADMIGGASIRPQFNPKGQTGMTGSVQAQINTPILTEPPVGTKVTLKKTTPEILDKLLKDGYVPGGVTPEGRPYMTYKGQPIDIEDPTVPLYPEEKASFTREMFNLPRGFSTSWDLSAPLRQGLPLALSKEFRKSLIPMVEALGDKGAYNTLIAEIKQRPLFKEDFSVDFSNGKWTRKRVPSIAEKAGLAITDLKGLKNREENLMSTWAEKIPGVKGSNRAYTVFLNKLRADTFQSLVEDATGQNLKPLENPQLLKEIADFVNTATGRGPLRTHLPTLSGGLKERSLEQAAGLLTDTLFSPRLVASRVRMLNPATYMAADPFVRKQYMKAMLTTATAWTTVLGLSKIAGANVSLDPTNADFGKARWGNTRLDPAAGFQQYLVAAARLLSGKTTPSVSPNNTREMGKGYQAPTRRSTAEQFGANKLHPVFKFAYDLWDASKYKPVQMGDRILQMYVPLVVQDVMELAKEDPRLLPLVIPTALGMGTQTYEKGSKDNLLIPPSMDYTFEGGSMF